MRHGLLSLNTSPQWLCTSDIANTRKKNRKHPPLFKYQRSHAVEMGKRAHFPEPKYIGGKAFWSAEEVSEFIESSPTGRASA